MPLQPQYTYAARILRWVDGDTVDVVIQLGFRVDVQQRVRLLGVDTPEKGRAGYVAARERAEQVAPVGAKVVLRSYKPDGADLYGRYLARVECEGRDVTSVLIGEGFGRPMDGTVRPPVLP